MKNCLFNKLKKSVDDSNLLNLGELRFHVKNNDSTTICPFLLVSSENFKVVVSSPGYLYKGTIANPTDITSTFEGNNTSGYRLSQGEYDVSVVSKYVLTTVNVNTSSTAVVDVNIKDFTYCNLDVLFLAGSGIIGKTSDFLNYKHLPVGNTDLRMTSLEGDISYIGKCLIMSTGKYIIGLSVANPLWDADSTKPTGTIEGFVENLNSGNYSKNFNFSTYHNVTFHDVLTVLLPGNPGVITVTVDASGNASVHKQGDSSTVYGTYTKATNTWVYPS